MLKKINFLFVTLFGIGKISKIPGSIASLVTTVFLFFLFHVVNISANIILVSIIVVFFVSLWSVSIFIKALDNKDPNEVVIDELIGQSIPIFAYEISHGTEKSPDEAFIFYSICFVLFRFFDIIKPFPVSFFDKNFKNSFGVIMDDVCAGLYVILSLICFMVLSSYLI